MSTYPEIPGYKIEKKIGHSAIAEVYLGVQEDLDRKVGIKVLNPQIFQDKSLVDKFLNEAKKDAKFSHVNIANILEVGEARHLRYIVMEYLPESLRDRITKWFEEGAADSGKASVQAKKKPDRAVVEILKQVARGLDYAHKNGVVHRNIRPENIRFREDGTAVIVDFFISKVLDHKTREMLKDKGITMGSPYYSSPEQALRKPVDGKSDIYSLGIVFYEMLTGGVPYDAEETIAIENQHIMEPVPQLPEHVKKFQTLLDRMMAKDPEERIATGAGVIQLLEQAADDYHGSWQPEPVKAESSTLKDFEMEVGLSSEDIPILEDLPSGPSDPFGQGIPPMRESSALDEITSLSDDSPPGGDSSPAVRFALDEITTLEDSSSLSEIETTSLVDDSFLGGGSSPAMPSAKDEISAPGIRSALDEISSLEDSSPLEDDGSYEETPVMPTSSRVKDEIAMEESLDLEDQIDSLEKRIKVDDKDYVKKAKKMKGRSRFSIQMPEPRILAIGGAVLVIIVLVVIFVIKPFSSGDEADISGQAGAEKAGNSQGVAAKKKPLTKEEQAENEMLYQHRFQLAQKFFKSGDYDKAKKKIEEAEIYNSTPESQKLAGEINAKLVEKKDHDTYNAALAAQSSAAMEKYLTEFPSGLHAREAEEKAKEFKIEEQKREAERKRMLASMVRLRSQGRSMTRDDVKAMLISRGFFENYYNKTGNFKNHFVLKQVKQDQIVVDLATGLAWHQSGSDDYMKHKAALEWIAELNKNGYAGYNDWRLPTLEEAASLLESREFSGGLFIDSVFSSDQRFIWTSDGGGDRKAWVIDFFSGDVSPIEYDVNVYVRPVRTMEGG